MNLTYKNRKEKGSVVVYVVVSMLFILIVLTIIYMSMENKSINQEKKIAKIQQEYNVGKSDNEILLLMKDQYNKIMKETNLNDDELREVEGSGIRELKKDEITNTTIKGILEDNNNNAIRAVLTGEVPIPEGFYYVGGTKDEGIVISDYEKDSGKGTNHTSASTLNGNQFVWVPVENESDFRRYKGYKDGELDNIPTNGTAQEILTSGGYSSEAADYNEMKTSVINYKGFYVARYEAGNDDSTLVSKQGETVYNNIKWGESMSDIGTSGAVYKSKNMYTGKSGFSVKSTLIYGVQWDAIMNWIDNNYKNENCSISSYVVQSSGRGVYEQNDGPSITGSNADYVTKNIYDLAGNVGEWTMEAYNTDNRVYRGGTYADRKDIYPASYRATSTPSTSNDRIGFRVALYL